MRLIVLVLFILGLGGRCLAGEKDDTRVNQDSCSQYCGGTYPEHTYPNVSVVGKNQVPPYSYLTGRARRVTSHPRIHKCSFSSSPWGPERGWLGNSHI